VTGSAGRGARVTQTGIALIHKGELVLPAAGSAAQAEQVLDDERAVIHYHFPVEIEVRGSAPAMDVDALVDQALTRFTQGLESV
jgi:hypothetical protein